MLRRKPRILRPKQDLVGAAPAPMQPQQLLLLLAPNELNGNNVLLLPPSSDVLVQQEQANLVDENVVNEPPKPYFRSVKGYIPDKKEVGDICRTCYRVIFNQNFIKLFDKKNKETSEKLRSMLKQVTPSINLDVYADPIMCVKCVKNLFSSYEFITKCLDTEEQFNNWISQRKSVNNSEVNLLILVEDSTDNDELEVSDVDKVEVPVNTQPQNDKSTEIGGEGSPVDLDHNYASVSNPPTLPRVKKKFSYRVKLSGEEVATRVKPKKIKKKGPFLCEQCGQLVRGYRSFREHSKLHSFNGFEEPLYKCQHCSYTAKSALLLRQHARRHIVPTHKCTECGKVYKWQKALELHVKNIHLGLVQSLQCHVCGKEFRYGSSLRIHLISHDPEGHMRYICEICGKRFPTKCKYKRHLLSHNENLYSCELCGRKLKRKENLQKHREIFHENKGKYKCLLCHKCYWKEEDLVRHKIRIHESGNDIKCNICQTYFTTQAKYTTHLSMMHNEKAYECEICGKKLKYARSVRTHYEIFHGNRGRFKCEICDRGYWKREDLLKHEFKIHQIEAVEDELDFLEFDDTQNAIHFDTNKENVVVEHLESFF